MHIKLSYLTCNQTYCTVVLNFTCFEVNIKHTHIKQRATLIIFVEKNQPIFYFNSVIAYDTYV